MDLSLLAYGSAATMTIHNNVAHVTPQRLYNSEHLDITIESVSAASLNDLSRVLTLKLLEARRLVSLRVSCDNLGTTEERALLRICVLLGRVQRLDLSTLYPCTVGVMRMLAAFTSLGELHLNLLPLSRMRPADVVVALASDARNVVMHLEVHECGALDEESLTALYHLPYLRRLALHRLVAKTVKVPSHMELSLTRVPGTKEMDKQYSFVRHQQPDTYSVFLCRVSGYTRPVMPTTIGLDSASITARALQRQELHSAHTNHWTYRDFTSAKRVAHGHLKSTDDVVV